MHRVSTLIACTLFALWGCGGDGPTTPGSVTESELTTAPAEVLVGGKALTLETSLWRDFQPISPPDGKPLVAILQIKTEDGSEVPGTVRADMVWVLNGMQRWSAVPQEERRRPETSPVYELVVRDGPKWGPGISVDVVVRLRSNDARAFLLRAADQSIRGTF
jgi:hypothetical protein